MQVNSQLAAMYEQAGKEGEAERLRKYSQKITEEVLEQPAAKRAEAATTVDAKLREIAELGRATGILWKVRRSSSWWKSCAHSGLGTALKAVGSGCDTYCQLRPR